jgi:PAS domain S-box-containing protein
MKSEHSRTILLVEDEAIIALKERKTLEAHGFTVTVARTGEEAIQAVQADPSIDLVLMDIDLGPGIPGTEAARRILARRAVPIVFLTGHTEKEYVESVEEITRYGYIVKNSGEFVLIQSIKMAFELFDREQRYSSLFYNTHSPMLLIRPETGHIVDANPAACDFYGWSQKALTGMTVHDINQFPEERVEKELSHARSEERNTFFFRHRRADGSVRDVEVRSSPISVGSEELLYSIIHDVTEQKRAERARAESEARFRRVYENMSVGVAQLSLDFRFEAANEAYCRMLGYAEEELIGLSIADLTSPEEVGSKTALIGQLARGEIEHYRTETSLVHKTGRTIRANVDANLIRDHDGKPSYLIGTTIDVTAYRDTLAALERSERHFRNIFDSTKDAIYIHTMEGQFLEVNAPACAKLGYTREELLTMGPADIDSQDHAPEAPKRMDHISRTGQMVFESIHRRKDGHEFPVEVSSKTIEYDGEKCIISVARDIAERRQTEQELARALSQTEQLLTELNHRVKNNLNMVASLIALKDASLGEAADLSDIHSRVSAITYVHDKLYQTADIDRIDVSQYLEDLLTGVFSLSTRGSVRLHKDIDRVIFPTETALNLGLIVNELATNALKYGFGDDETPEFFVELRKSEEGGEFELVVSNSGAPFPDSVDLENPQSLGLQLVAGLVAQLQGKMRLRRTPRPTFEIVFPAAA